MTTSFQSLDVAVPVGSTARYTALLVDERLLPLAASSLATLTLTLLESSKKIVVNSVSAVNILNTDRGTLDANGNLAITLTPGDTTLVDPRRTEEGRSMIVEWTYSGTKKGRHEVRFPIVALSA